MYSHIFEIFANMQATSYGRASMHYKAPSITWYSYTVDIAMVT